jgi:Type II secretion system (T2SS), protein E, N-terminal domain
MPMPSIVSDTTMTAAPAMRRWRVEVLDRADLVFSLRDYFRRLGLAAEVQGPTLVEVTGDRDPVEIAAWAANWSKKQDAPLDVEELRESSQALVAPAPRSGSPRLGTLLVGKGYLTPEQLADALAESHATRDLLGVVLLRKELIFEDELARTLSEQLAIPYVSIGRVGVDASVARLLPAEVGAAAAAIPVRRMGGTLQVAFADPTDAWALAEVRRYLPSIEIVVAELSDIRLAWRNVSPRASR